jgi:hypothetical protein
MQKHYDHVYIGAGIVNILDCIYQSKFGYKNLIIEKNNEIGGSWSLIKLDNGVIAENAVHYLLPNDEGINFIKKNLKIELKEIKKKFRFFNLPIGYFKTKFNSKFSEFFRKFDQINFYLSGRYKKEDWYDLNNTNDSKSYYFKNGIYDLINKLQIEIKNSNIKINFNCKVKQINFLLDKKYAEIKCENNKNFFCKKVIFGNGLNIDNINIVNNKLKKKFKSGGRILLRPAIHLLIKNCNLDNIDEAIFINDNVLKYCHDITDFCKFDKHHIDKVLVLAIKGSYNQEDLNYILKVLKKINMISNNSIVCKVYHNNYWLPSWSPNDLKNLSYKTNGIFDFLITENFTYSLGKYGQKWKKNIY